MTLDHILYILPRGVAIGALISAPMGPIGMLIIQRTLSKGRWPAFFTGVGAALSDLVYCLLTGFCLSFITDFIDANRFYLQVFGSIVLAAFGYYLYRKRPRATVAANTEITRNATGIWADVVSGFFLTFSNPLILFFIIGLFARFDFVLPDFGLLHYIIGYAFILLGALLWWYVVTMLVSKLRARLNQRAIRSINKTIGALLILMSLVGIVASFSETGFEGVLTHMI